MSQSVRVVRAGERSEDPTPTPGMTREEAILGDGAWSGVAHTEPGAVTAWHTHPGWDTYVYVVAGSLRVESGARGADVADASRDDFVLIPRGVVHRESNPGSEPTRAVVTRVGSGPLVENVDGPEG